MEKKYKIGDISKLINIPVQTLRFYEEKKIVSPEKDENNGYRYYNAWNINDLMDTMMLRESDFSLQQISDILNTNNLDDMSIAYMSQEAYLLDKIEQYKAKLAAVSSQRIRMQNFQAQVGVFTECVSPGLIYHRHRKKNQFITAGGSEKLSGLSKELAPWFAAFPMAAPTFYIPAYELSKKGSDDGTYWWGLSISTKDSRIYGLRAEAPNEYIPSSHCIYTVFQAGEEGTFYRSFHQQVYKKILDAGYLVSGNIHGRLIVKIHEPDGYKRYFEVWVPVSG